MATTDWAQKNFIARKPLLAYFVFSFVFFWLFVTLCVIAFNILHLKPDTLPSWLMSLVTIIGSWMPTFAAVIAINTNEGSSGVSRLFRKFIRFKVPAKWYLAALIPFGLVLVAVGIYQAVGRIASAKPHSLLFWIGVIAVNFPSGPTGEEFGWRGFALPRLLKKYTPLKAGIILGVIWDFWHLPLRITSGYTSVNLLLYCLYFSIGIISLSVLMAWIFYRTPYSLVPMVIAHFSFNTGLYLFGPQGFGLVPTLPLFGPIAALFLVTVVIVWATGVLRVEPTM
jgi:membrane protease YdiL (CAAX protease family)